MQRVVAKVKAHDESQMTPRERVKAAMHFRKPDMLPWSESFHDEAVNEWFSQGLSAKEVAKYGFTFSDGRLLIGLLSFIRFDLHSYFDCLDLFSGCPVPVDVGPIPRFKERATYEDAQYLDYVLWSGARARRRKARMYSMPMFTDFPVKDKKTWEEYRQRLNPKDPRRYPKDWEKDSYIDLFEDFQRQPTVLSFNGFYGFGAQLMGIVNFNLAFHTDPELIHSMVQYWEYFTIETIRDAVETLKGRIDLVFWWEDMADKHGPNISPKFCREFLLSHYKKVTGFLNRNSIDRIMMDSDGNMNPCLDFLVEAGITGTWPLEVNSGMDARLVKKKYGNKLFLAGNLDKRELVKGGEAMRREIDSKVLILKETSGYIAGADHLIGIEFSYDRFREYEEYLKKQLPY